MIHFSIKRRLPNSTLFFAVNDAAEYSVPPDKPVTIKSDGASIPEWTQGLISLKEYANDGNNFTKVATSIDFEGIIKNIDNSNKFVTLKDALKTYDVVGFKVILRFCSIYDLTRKCHFIVDFRC